MENETVVPTYRKAIAEDIDALSGIRCEFLCETGGLDGKTLKKLEVACKDYFISAIAEGSFAAWIAEAGGAIIATSGICFYSVPPNKSCPNGKVAYIQNMYTKKEHRRQGIAKTLFKKMIEEAKKHGCTKILLNALDMGRPMYEKFGFKEVHGDMAYHL